MSQLVEPRSEDDRVAHMIIGAAIEVHRHLGPGFLESCYEHALFLELEARRLRVERQVPIPVAYKGNAIGELRLDLLVEQRVIIELKAVESLSNLHFTQTISYLRAANLQLALLLNFNVPVLKDGLRRVVNGRDSEGLTRPARS